MREVLMYSRRRCGLCDRARVVLEDVRLRVPFHLEEVLLDGDEGLEREYGLRVPVILVDGEEAFELEVDPDALERFLRGSPAGV